MGDEKAPEHEARIERLEKEMYEAGIEIDSVTMRDAELDDVIHYFVYNADYHAELLLG